MWAHNFPKNPWYINLTRAINLGNQTFWFRVDFQFFFWTMPSKQRKSGQWPPNVAWTTASKVHVPVNAQGRKVLNGCHFGLTWPNAGSGQAECTDKAVSCNMAWCHVMYYDVN